MEARSKWVIFYKGKVIPVGDDTINWIRRDPTEIWGWFEMDLMQAWKNMFPLTETSKNLGYLPLKDEAWSLISNPWWRFLTNRITVLLLRAIRINIREAAFRKISDKSGNRVDTASDSCEENLTGQACGMYDDRALASSKADPVCGANDFNDHSYQGFSRNARDHQALNDTLSRQNDVEEGGDGSMDIEGLRE